MNPLSDVPGVQKSMHGSDSQVDLSLTTVRSPDRIQCPSLSQALSELALLPLVPTLTAIEPLPSEEQKSLFHSLQTCLKSAEDLELSEALKDIPGILHKLWICRSHYLVPAAEALANGSRDRKSPPAPSQISQVFPLVLK